MSIATSKLTAQGQTSVPAEVRRKLGLEPGSVLEWEEDGSRIVVRRASTYTPEEIRAVLFPNGTPTRRSRDDLKEGIRRAVKKRHARR